MQPLFEGCLSINALKGKARATRYQQEQSERAPNMTSLLSHLIFWLVALAIVATVGLFSGLYLYAQVEPLYDKPLAAFSLRDLGQVVLLCVVVLGAPMFIVRGIGKMIETSPRGL